MLDDLALVLSPPLDREAEQPPLVHAPSGVRLEAHSRAASTSATVKSTIASRSATETCSSGVWKPKTPCDRFTQRSPRPLKTFASAAPPEAVEDVCIGAAPREPIAWLEAATCERRRRQRDGWLVALQPVAVVAL